MYQTWKRIETLVDEPEITIQVDKHKNIYLDGDLIVGWSKWDNEGMFLNRVMVNLRLILGQDHKYLNDVMEDLKEILEH
jgi:hypothetical protein